MGRVKGGKSLSKTVQRSFTVKRHTLECPQAVVKPNGHHRGQGYNFRSMPFIWCAPQVPLCQFYIYTVLKSCPEKSRLIKYGDWIHRVMIRGY